MKTALKVLFACAIGTYLGLLALRINPLLILLAGPTGGLAWAVIQAIPKAWKKIISWRPDKKKWRLRLWKTATFVGSALTLAIPCYIFYLLALKTPTPHLTKAGEWLACLCANFPIFFLSLSPFVAVETLENRKTIEISIVKWRKLAWRLSPMAIYAYYPFYCLYRVIDSILHLLSLIFSIIFYVSWKIIRAVPNAFRNLINTLKAEVPKVIATIIQCIIGVLVAFAKLMWNVLVLIHSKPTLICTVDPTIGALISLLLFKSNALIGAIIGGIYGFLNYLILSVFTLKLRTLKE